MDTTPNTTFNVIRQTVTGPSRKLNAKWTLVNDLTDEPYELTDEEKEGMSASEQETWRILKTTERVGIESQIASILSAELAKSIDSEILKEMLIGKSIK